MSNITNRGTEHITQSPLSDTLTGSTDSSDPSDSSTSKSSFSGHAISQTTPNSSKKNVSWSPTKEIKDTNDNITHVHMEEKENIKETEQTSNNDDYDSSDLASGETRYRLDKHGFREPDVLLDQHGDPISRYYNKKESDKTDQGSCNIS
jgi:hypothetical protein